MERRGMIEGNKEMKIAKEGRKEGSNKGSRKEVKKVEEGRNEGREKQGWKDKKGKR